ncbi:hypothetical protein ACHAPJ_012450 [Fusarium lateritium]
MRDFLLSQERPHSLSDIIRIGRELAKAVSYVHLLDFVHKNIRPESILLPRHTETNEWVTYLVGFQKFRKDGGMTSRLGSSDWEQSLYCHPRRYGKKPEDAYIMQHDIYSLGVCLLEIGLWESFVLYEETGQVVPSALIESFLSSDTTSRIETLKNGLVTLARTSLPGRTGSKYAEIVETCLTCLDESNTDFGDEAEFLDTDGILVGVRYIEKYLDTDPFGQIFCHNPLAQTPVQSGYQDGSPKTLMDQTIENLRNRDAPASGTPRPSSSGSNSTNDHKLSGLFNANCAEITTSPELSSSPEFSDNDNTNCEGSPHRNITQSSPRKSNLTDTERLLFGFCREQRLNITWVGTREREESKTVPGQLRVSLRELAAKTRGSGKN